MKSTELNFSNLSTYNYGVEAYNPNSLGLGTLMGKRSLSSSEEDKFVGPYNLGVARPLEQSIPVPATFPWAMQWSSTKDWVFLCETGAGITRRFITYTFDRTDSSFTCGGAITVTFPTAIPHTIRSFRMTYDLINTGTVSVSSSSVTGVGTNWLTRQACVGNRIGFGSTNPNLIDTWYEISAIGSDTSITLTTPVPTNLPANTPFVIEDLRAIIVTTNTTLTTGGLFVVKGLRRELFNSMNLTGTVIPAATTVDNIRACYWLADAATVTNTVPFGCALEERTGNTAHNVWVIDTLANPVLFKYNIRAPLTLTAGKATNAFLFKTGAGGALTGTPSQLNNARIATTNHGPGSGVPCIYFTTASRIYRTSNVNSITASSTSWLADSAVEIPPGSTSSYISSNVLSALEYSSILDKFIVTTNNSNTMYKNYVTQYRTDGGQWDRFFGTDNKQYLSTLADLTTTPHPQGFGGIPSVWSEGGLLYYIHNSTINTTNVLFSIPLSGDWEYADTTKSCIITPKIPCIGNTKFSRVYTQQVEVVGGNTGANLGLTPEPYKTYYRTTGIDDDSGSWTLLSNSGNISNISPSTYIQLKYTFRTIGTHCIPSRLLGCCVNYSGIETGSNFQFSSSKSDALSSRFSWRISTPFGTTIPNLFVKLYDAVTGNLLVSDTTDSATGTFEKSTDGGTTWLPYSNADAANTNTYIRYTPASIGSNIIVRASIGEA